MIDISKTRYLKYLFFGSLYFSQGLVAAIANVILPVYLKETGFPIATITIIAGIVLIPWTIKFVWGGITDYFIQHGRKRFIIIGGLLGFFGLFSLAFINPFVSLIPFIGLLIITQTGVAFLDVSADAWAIQISHNDERGKINGAMMTGLFGGMAIGSALLGFIANIAGYSYAFLVASFLILIIILFPLSVKEIKIVKKRQKIIKTFVHEFKKKNTLLIAIFSPIVSINNGLLMFIIPLYMVTVLKLNVAQIGLITAIFPITLAIGSMMGGAMSDRWGRKKILYAFLGISIIIYPIFILANTWETLVIIYGIVGFLMGGSTFATLCAMFMDETNPKIGAFQYSAFTSLSNFGDIGTRTISGSLVTLLGFSRMFLLSAWSIGPALLILYFISLKKSIKKTKLS